METACCGYTLNKSGTGGSGDGSVIRSACSIREIRSAIFLYGARLNMPVYRGLETNRVLISKMASCMERSETWFSENSVLSKYLKCYYDQKITFIFSSDFETMFVKHSPSEIISVNFEKKTVNLNCNFPV